MKNAYWSLLALGMMVVVGASACTGAAPAAPTAAPSLGATTTPAASAGTVSAEVVVEPTQSSELAFVIQARVKDVSVKAGDQVKAGQSLIVLDTPDLENELVSAQAEADSAEKNDFLQRSTRQYKIWTGHKWIWTHGIQEVRLIADARLEQALGALDVAKANLAQGTMVAPFDGTVVSINVVPGEIVDAHKTVLVIADLSRLQIATTDLSEREIADLQIGQKATVQLKAFPEDLTGKVIAISPLADEYNGDTVFKVTVQLDKQPKGLLWGMTGDITIDTR